jgi:uncharacterized membrane protein YphA (DoxX/SURF4 family)
MRLDVAIDTFLLLLPLTARVGAGCVLTVAAIRKLRAPEATGLAMRALLPIWLPSAAMLSAKLVALAVGIVELMLGCALIGGVLQPWPALIAAGLLMAFSLILIAALRRGIRKPCGCFGQDRPLDHMAVARNAVFLVILLMAVHDSPSWSSR